MRSCRNHHVPCTGLLTIVLALFLPALVIGYVAINPPEDSPYDLPQTLVPEGFFPSTSAEVRSEAVVPTAAFTRVVIAGAAQATLDAVTALGYPTVVSATSLETTQRAAPPTASGIHRARGLPRRSWLG